MQRVGLCQLNGCDNMLFANVSIIRIQISTVQHVTEQKLGCTFNNCSLVVIGNWILEKSLSAFSGSSRLLAVHKKSVVEQGFFHEFAFDNTALKTFDEFESVENVRSSNVVEFKFELRHIPNGDAMVVFHNLCRAAGSSTADKTESVSAMDHTCLAAMCSTGLDQRQRNFFVHMSSFWSKVLRGCRVRQLSWMVEHP